MRGVFGVDRSEVGNRRPGSDSPASPGKVSNDRELKYWVGLRLLPAIEMEAGRLVGALGSAEAVWRAGAKALVSCGVSENKAGFVAMARRNINLDEELAKLKDAAIEAVMPVDPRYPAILREIAAPPHLLFVRGDLLFRYENAVSIVGARKASAYGRAIAEEMARDLSTAGVTIVSGLAQGVDSAAHRGAVGQAGGTIAVLGCGLDIIYPPRNRALQEEIARAGSLVSEYSLGRIPLPRNFPARNRIISGLSAATLVVEAGEKSGALITVDFALDQGREVFAVPGHSKSPLSKGCHKLLKQGAHLAESAEDVLEVLGLARSPGRKEQELSTEEKRLLEVIGWEPVTTDHVTRSLDMEAGAIAALLTVLEVKGLVRRDLGDRILRIQ